MQRASAESNDNIIESGDGSTLLDQDILFFGPALGSSVICPLAKPFMVFVISVDDMKRDGKSKPLAMAQGGRSVLLEKSEVSDLDGRLDMVLVKCLVDAIKKTVPSGVSVAYEEYFHGLSSDPEGRCQLSRWCSLERRGLMAQDARARDVASEFPDIVTNVIPVGQERIISRIPGPGFPDFHGSDRRIVD